MPAPSMQSLMGDVPPYTGLVDYPGLAMRSRQATQDYMQDTLADVSDPFRFMKADQALQAGQSSWAPFFQRLQEQGVGGVRFAGYNPKAAAAADTARQGAMYGSASKAMPFNLPGESYPVSVRRLISDDDTVAKQQLAALGGYYPISR